MILQALTDYYGVLSEAGDIAPMGWAPAKVSYALCLREDGSIEAVVDIRTEQQRGKKQCWPLRIYLCLHPPSVQSMSYPIFSGTIQLTCWESMEKEILRGQKPALKRAESCTFGF